MTCANRAGCPILRFFLRRVGFMPNLHRQALNAIPPFAMRLQRMGHPAMRVTASPLIFIEAWNELGEGSYLVPTSGDGFAYTDAMKQGLSAAGACKQQ